MDWLDMLIALAIYFVIFVVCGVAIWFQEAPRGYRYPHESETEAMRSDWRRVGNDMWKAIEKMDVPRVQRHTKLTIIHHVSARHLMDVWDANPQWENGAPQWWHLLFQYASDSFRADDLRLNGID